MDHKQPTIPTYRPRSTSENTRHIFSHQNYIYLLYLDCHVKWVKVILAGKIIMTSMQALHTQMGGTFSGAWNWKNW